MVRNEEFVVMFDVDYTLIMWDQEFVPGEGKIAIQTPCGETRYFRPHKRHIDLLKNYVARGATVIVWSGGGRAWSKLVTEALGIDHLVYDHLPKPVKYVDDHDAQIWFTGRIWLEDV